MTEPESTNTPERPPAPDPTDDSLPSEVAEILGEEVDGELTEERRRRILRKIEAHSGPLPSPAQLRAYGEIVPGLDKTIVNQWLDETTHRRNHENELRHAIIESERRGQWFGFILGALVVAVAILAILLDRTGIGISAFVVGGAVLIGTAVWGHPANGPDDETNGS